MTEPEDCIDFQPVSDVPGSLGSTLCLMCGGLKSAHYKVNETRLRDTLDASVWAEEFAKVCPEVDRGLMVAWFANAIETARIETIASMDPALAVHPQPRPAWSEDEMPDATKYLESECFVAGALSTMPPFASYHPAEMLPVARRALEALSEWEPSP